MNRALQNARSEWRYELKGALPTLRSSKPLRAEKFRPQRKEPKYNPNKERRT